MGRRAWLGLGLALLGAASCALEPSRSAAVVGLPPEIDWVAAALVVDGEVVAATGLHPRDDLASGDLPRPPGDGALVVVGFTAEQVSPWGPPPVDVLRASALRPPAPDESVLPVPAYEAGPPDEPAQVALQDRDPSLSLTADWVAGCPTLLDAPTPYVDLSCAIRDCAGEARQVGCRLEVSAIACGGGELTATIGARGELRYAETEELGVCAPLEDPATLAAAACTGGPVDCDVRVYPDDAEQRWTVRTQSIVAADPALFDDREPAEPADGWIGAFAVLDDRALAFDFAGAYSFDCDAVGGRVHTLDLETLEVTRTATAPPCVRLARVEPGGASLLALYGRTAPRLGRFDADGRLVASAPLGLPLGGETVLLSDLHIGDGYVAALAGEVGIDAPEYLSLHDPETLAVRTVSPPLVERTSMLQPLVTGELAVVNRGSSELIVVDPETGALGTQVALRQICGGRGHFDMTAFPGAEAYALTSLRDRAELRVLSDRLDRCVTHRFLPEAVDHTVVRPAPWNPRQLAVGIIDLEPPRAARLALFDADRGRFLRGAAPLGNGLLDQLQADGAGRLWVSLPWSGEIARVEPTP